MAPATNLGAATPVAIGPQSEPREPGAAKGTPGKDGDRAADPQSTAQTMARKQTNDAAAYIRGLAQLRGRNAEWAERAVREAVSLSAREKLNADIQQALDAQTDSWGIKVANVEIKQVDLTESMIRAIARQAEAERERRAKVIHAEGELQAAEKLFQAAKILAQEPQAIQLRYLETLTVIGADKNTTIVFPLPIDLLTPFMERIKKNPDS